jgi:hypothetical protein
MIGKYLLAYQPPDRPFIASRFRIVAWGLGAVRSPMVVDLATVTDGHHEDQQDLVVDFVDDAVVACPAPPLTIAAQEVPGPAGRGSVASNSTAAWIRRRAGGSSLRSCCAAAGVKSIRWRS